MGKYTRKTKPTTNILAVIDVSTGVRTRATTLALQKLQASKPTTTQPTRDPSYLHLRSRKLHKPPLPQPNPNPNLLNNSTLQIRSSGSNHALNGSEEASFGDNNFDLDTRERSTRESTPCSFIRDSSDSNTPVSSTRHAIVPNSIQRIMPSAQEIEEFFARHAQEQQRLFSEKYNFDILNEKPLRGRYEWVKVDI